jgi:hypothetical protein
MKSLEEEARIHANLKEGFDYAEESYYQPTKINAYRSFQDGANSKWVQTEKIRAQIEAAHSISTNIVLHNFRDIKSYKEEKNKIEDYINNLKQQLKQLEDDSNS